MKQRERGIVRNATYGILLPQRVLVLSEICPANGSLIAFQMAYIVIPIPYRDGKSLSSST
jgi:hypothetical protein